MHDYVLKYTLALAYAYIHSKVYIILDFILIPIHPRPRGSRLEYRTSQLNQSFTRAELIHFFWK